MAYGHAERALAAIRLLEAETRELLSGLSRLDPEQTLWLREVTEARSRLLPPTVAGRPAGHQAAIR
ncbi:MAG TPA: hypothetical protein VEH31_19195 [Streptosporangiaceae bacterium]|nr:hypothetical protein [Streptosporangiaceae bacterium]